MKPCLFVDTDVVLDLLARREPFYGAAARLFSEAEAGNLTLCVSSLTFANLFYLLRKQHPGPQAQQVLRTFKQLVSVVSVDDTIVEQALHAGFTGFEDALQYFCALSARCSGLITRNVRHYRKSSIRVVTAEGYFAAVG